MSKAKQKFINYTHVIIANGRKDPGYFPPCSSYIKKHRPHRKCIEPIPVIAAVLQHLLNCKHLIKRYHIYVLGRHTIGIRPRQYRDFGFGFGKISIKGESVRAYQDGAMDQLYLGDPHLLTHLVNFVSRLYERATSPSDPH